VRAVDTNILVRLVARDDHEQARAADGIIAGGEVLVLPSVLLETEWVLRSRYAMPRDEIATRLSAVCGQEGVTVASEGAILAALTAYADAGDFADLLHFALASEAGATAFITFDRGFAGVDQVPLELEIIQ
jgi:predicted nucleic-acid-binding protein